MNNSESGYPNAYHTVKIGQRNRQNANTPTTTTTTTTTKEPETPTNTSTATSTTTQHQEKQFEEHKETIITKKRGAGQGSQQLQPNKEEAKDVEIQAAMSQRYETACAFLESAEASNSFIFPEDLALNEKIDDLCMQVEQKYQAGKLKEDLYQNVMNELKPQEIQGGDGPDIKTRKRGAGKWDKRQGQSEPTISSGNEEIPPENPSGDADIKTRKRGAAIGQARSKLSAPERPTTPPTEITWVPPTPIKISGAVPNYFDTTTLPPAQSVKRAMYNIEKQEVAIAQSKQAKYTKKHNKDSSKHHKTEIDQQVKSQEKGQTQEDFDSGASALQGISSGGSAGAKGFDSANLGNATADSGVADGLSALSDTTGLVQNGKKVLDSLIIFKNVGLKLETTESQMAYRDLKEGLFGMVGNSSSLSADAVNIVDLAQGAVVGGADLIPGLGLGTSAAKTGIDVIKIVEGRKLKKKLNKALADLEDTDPDKRSTSYFVLEGLKMANKNNIVSAKSSLALNGINTGVHILNLSGAGLLLGGPANGVVAVSKVLIASVEKGADFIDAGTAKENLKQVDQTTIEDGEKASKEVQRNAMYALCLNHKVGIQALIDEARLAGAGSPQDKTLKTLGINLDHTATGADEIADTIKNRKWLLGMFNLKDENPPTLGETGHGLKIVAADTVSVGSKKKKVDQYKAANELYRKYRAKEASNEKPSGFKKKAKEKAVTFGKNVAHTSRAATTSKKDINEKIEQLRITVTEAEKKGDITPDEAKNVLDLLPPKKEEKK